VIPVSQIFLTSAGTTDRVWVPPILEPIQNCGTLSRERGPGGKHAHGSYSSVEVKDLWIYRLTTQCSRLQRTSRTLRNSNHIYNKSTGHGNHSPLSIVVCGFTTDSDFGSAKLKMYRLKFAQLISTLKS
jgi:hypothetical protein